MERKQKIMEYRGIFDKTLASDNLANEDFIRRLVQNQLQSSPSEAQEKRIKEVTHLLDIMRSASGNDFKRSKSYGMQQAAWKLKEDNDEYRVMYREGPQGSPFHTLLAEGYVNAPLDFCLCAGWEVGLYKNWWPQIKVPPFKVLTACCLEKVRIDEQLSLLRMKVPWPLSNRELVLNYFELECLEDGLVIVLLNTISDPENVDKRLLGFTNDELSEAKDSVSMDMTGGFVLKRITSKVSYYRTMGILDLKLEFVPPSLINFMSRQLLGSACKLFQKTVTSMARDDGDFGKALEDPLYVRIREHLHLSHSPEHIPG